MNSLNISIQSMHDFIALNTHAEAKSNLGVIKAVGSEETCILTSYLSLESRHRLDVPDDHLGKGSMKL